MAHNPVDPDQPRQPRQTISAHHDAPAMKSDLLQSLPFMDHMPLAMAVFDSEMRYLAANRRWLEDYRLVDQAVMGRSHYEVVPEMPEHWQQVHERCLTGATEYCEEDLWLRSDGTTDWVRWEVYPWRNDHGEIGGLIICTEIITERKQMEEALNHYREHLEELVDARVDKLVRENEQFQQTLLEHKLEVRHLQENEERFRITFEQAAVGIARVGIDGQFLDLNQKFCDIVGYSRTEIQACSFQEFTHSNDIEADLKEVRQLLRGDTQTYAIEKRYIRKGGTLVWVNLTVSLVRDFLGQPRYFIVVAEDISHRKHTEAALQLSESKLQEKARRLEQTLDILQEAQAQLIQYEKFSGLGQLVAGVVHEVNNPISFIYSNLPYAVGYTEDLLALVQQYQAEPFERSPELQEYLETLDLEFLTEDLPKLMASMQRGVDRIIQIVDALQIFSQVDQASLKMVDLHQSLDSTLMMLSGRLRAQESRPAIQILKQYDEELPKIPCYARQLNQVFLNVLNNAIDALEKRDQGRADEDIRANLSTITLATELTDRESVIIRIVDNGPGMSRDVMQQIFDPFFSTKALGQGTGMGMADSQQIIVSKHQGKLQCNSEVEKGTTVVIELPLWQAGHLDYFEANPLIG